ncbi:MAG: hypothetical protein LBG22_04145 [Treponema sp.]|jgi:hypothetical protein|nr:hypothetical protein [Treponema sp.]
MRFLQDLPERMKGLVSKVLDFAGKAPVFLNKNLSMKTFEEIIRSKHRFVFLGLGAAALLLIVLLIVFALASGKAEVKQAESMEDVFPDALIQAQDLFLPEEPDFLPSLIPERERRETWTGEDAGEFWYDPLRRDERLWRERARQTVDRLLERIP